MATFKKADENRDGVWTELDRRFRAPLTAFFNRRVYDRGEAEDLTQEVFVRLARRPDQNGGESIDAYVFKIASNVLNDWGRRRIRRRVTKHDAIDEIFDHVGVPAVLVEDRTPERVLVGKEAIKGIEGGLAELGERTREIFLLSRMENVPHRDIANLHGISVSAVEKHVLKAIAYLSARALR